MAEIPATLSYAIPISGNCPLCHNRPCSKKSIYGTPVCKKCYYAFANRRQLAYLIDAIILAVVSVAVDTLLARLLTRMGFTVAVTEVASIGISIGLACVFIMKDGFSGQSPGKRLTDVQVLDHWTGLPIGFKRSFKRNSILLLGRIPVIGGLVKLVVILIIAVQVAGGYRLGDGFAQTRVIWRKYARAPVFGGDGLICESCGYDLHGNLSGICPECGTPISEQNIEQLALLR